MEYKLNILDIIRENNKVYYKFDYSENLQKYFNPKEEFFIEYDDGLSTVPDSILVIPFLCNVLPIVWLLDVTLYVPEIDENFFTSIPEFKKGYINMYPRLKFTGKIIVDKIIDNNGSLDKTGSPLAFFSGGVDAFNTLVNHIEEKPVLMTLWGSDVFFDDINGWQNVKSHVIETAERFGVECKFIKSNFRKFINETTLADLVLRKANDGWWHGFQHGIGLIGHAAPLAYIYGSKVVYIASSFTAKDAKKVVCASDPTIDNYVKWANTGVIHDGYEHTRQEKIKKICSFVSSNPNLKINLRVCWQSSGGKNCVRCEKCYRTIMGILAEGQNPNDYGLIYSKIVGNKIKNDIVYKVNMDPVRKAFWRDIQNQFLQIPNVFIEHPELEWILKIDFESIHKNLIRFIYQTVCTFLNLPKKILRKILRVFNKQCN